MKIQTRDLAFIGLYAALYAALVIFLPGISYGPIQVRIADSLLAVVPLLGLAGVLGHTLGVLLQICFLHWAQLTYLTQHHPLPCSSYTTFTNGPIMITQ